MDIKAKFDRAADVFMGKPEALYEQACESKGHVNCSSVPPTRGTPLLHMNFPLWR